MRTALFAAVLILAASAARAAEPAAAETPSKKLTAESLVRTVDLALGQQETVTLWDGSQATVKLLSIDERRDPIRNALRLARVTIEVDGSRVVVPCATYHLPMTVGRVQIDCPVVKGYHHAKNVPNRVNPWSLDADARLRLWPAGSPWIEPGTFDYPVPQRWFAGGTLMANEIGDGEQPDVPTIYYHYGLDFGGCERLVEVRAATDGVVVSVGKEVLQGGPYPDMFEPRYDVVYLRDDRGWYYRYSHLDSIDPAIQLGDRVKIGQRIGVLGKEGASGGWSHLHFDLNRPMPSGRYGIDDAYAFVWQAYQARHKTPLVAVARPHEVAWAGDPVTLDASRSYSADGPAGLRFEWILGDGTTAAGATLARRYPRPGGYAELLKVTDAAGRVDYDFASVIVLDRDNPANAPPGLHATYWPTFGIQQGDEVTFKVRAFGVRPDEGRETWDFGDGSPAVTTQSDGGADQHAKNGYAVTMHRFAKSGHYLVRVQRTNDRGETATDWLQVRVGLKAE